MEPTKGRLVPVLVLSDRSTFELYTGNAGGVAFVNEAGMRQLEATNDFKHVSLENIVDFVSSRDFVEADIFDRLEDKGYEFDCFD